MKTLSVVMIVKNEEELLSRCLDSIQGADEIIICDTGSEDSTVSIAKKYTDKVFTDYKWNDSFADARNHALKKATGDWILSIDADEFLLPQQMDKIKELINTAGNKRTYDVIMDSGYSTFYFPRIFINKPKEVFWQGAIHNTINIVENNLTDIKIHYDYSPAHKKDPDRSLRILQKEVKKNPDKPRELFYLAREYWYYQNYEAAIYYFQKYVSIANWAPEWAEGYYFLARCYDALDENDKAKDACLQAIKINADYIDALTLMANLCGPNNRLKWLEYAQYAENKFVLTDGRPPERDRIYYDELWSDTSGMERYEELNKLAAEWCKGKTLDIGCGIGQMSKYIKDYKGFDFSEVAIKEANNPNCWVGDIYDKSNYQGDYETYLCLEVIEHVDDFKLLRNIPQGKPLVFSVPSFSDPGHRRTFDEDILKIRYKHYLDIKKTVRFNWNDRWEKGGKNTSSFILLSKAIKI